MNTSSDLLDYPAPGLKLTAEGRIEAANAWAESLFEQDLNVLEGQYWYVLALPEQQPALARQWQAFIQKAQPLFAGAFQHNSRRRAEIGIRIQRTSGGCLAVCEDRSERLQMQHSLTALSEKLSALFRSSNQSIFILDRAHRIRRR